LLPFSLQQNKKQEGNNNFGSTCKPIEDPKNYRPLTLDLKNAQEPKVKKINVQINTTFPIYNVIHHAQKLC
jgi:hypothetical protein